MTFIYNYSPLHFYSHNFCGKRLSVTSCRPKYFAVQQSPQPEESEEYEDQWSQYEKRDRKSLQQNLQTVRSLPYRECHHHVFLQAFAIKPFNESTSRFIKSARLSLSTDKYQQERTSRLWILRAIEDPYFGLLRGEPHPPRALIMERLPKLKEQDFGRVHVAEDSDTAGIRKWISALDRTGKVLSPMDSHNVEWASVGGSGSYESATLPDGALVACEVLNANWVRSSAIPGLRDVMLKHSENIVRDGYAISYEVLQSVDEPTCFKSTEVFPDMQHLEEYMKYMDPVFEDQAKVHRAAVYRVRQLYKPIQVLHLDFDTD